MEKLVTVEVDYSTPALNINSELLDSIEAEVEVSVTV